MARGKRKSQLTCSECDKPFYAKGLCKPCYMIANRERFTNLPPKSINQQPFDPEDFWQFVKKELNLV